MRKQYHFRQINQQLYAWDVERLIQLTQGLHPETIHLNEINEFNETYWYSDEGDSPTCRSIAEHMKLIKEADLAYPILICPEGKLMDGMHRVVKAYLEGLSSVQAFRLAILPQPDYIDVNPDDLPYDEA
ncbi:hypothetical protein [Sphingobacterium faecale]|uniref:Chromosome partitioning protein ParB n=1 Tax=Sphingobacterium faecale TaxID=2803775 RepID=A0ABS1QYZ7_9SPHI|nr:hypothetical protein [Sphingobacterium faecale]MBL1407656.1 hypothetical protein [Sphingobacterium faecale]